MAQGFDESTARQVLMVQAFETAAAGSPLWTAEDQAWATRLAIDGVGAGAGPERFLAERARHALQRLRPRDAQVGRWLEAPGWSPAWPWLALLVGAIAGLATDAIGAGQRINLLAPPVWAVVLWNLSVVVALAVQTLRRRALPAEPGPWRRALMRLQQLWRPLPVGAVLQAFAALWARAGASLQGARLALLLHLAALALGAGLVAGLYTRGLVLDYRAGWQSTFLDAPAVHMLLSTLLAPASLISGVAVPPVEVIAALRVVPGAEATASAAPWIHLFATTIALFVLLPRGLLAAVAAWRARRLALDLRLPLDEPYFRRLLQRHAGGAPSVQLWPHGAPASAQQALGLRRLLAQTWGEELQLVVAPTTAHGAEDIAPASGDEPAWVLRAVLFDLAATPEDEAQGRFVAALRASSSGSAESAKSAKPTVPAAAVPLLVVVDEAAFRRRFAATPERWAERRAAWQRWADRHAVVLWSGDLEAADLSSARPLLERLAGG